MITTRPYLREVVLKREGIPDSEVYPFNLPAVRELGRLRFHPDVTFIVGENGSGKSTLLEAIAVAWGFNPEGGTKNFNFATHNSHSPLHSHLKLVRSAHKPRDGFFFRAESFFNLSTNIEVMDSEPSNAPPVINSYGGRSLHEQSHGESFLALMMKRFDGRGLYILDEPEAALSPTRQLSVLMRMHELVQKDSQFIVATHSPVLMAYPGATLFSLDERGYTKVSYKETEHYQVMEQFINNTGGMLEAIMSPDDE
jgi:predicted ATPase